MLSEPTDAIPYHTILLLVPMDVLLALPFNVTLVNELADDVLLVPIDIIISE